MKTKSVKVNALLLEALRKRAKRNGQSITFLLDKAIRLFIRTEREEKRSEREEHVGGA